MRKCISSLCPFIFAFLFCYTSYSQSNNVQVNVPPSPEAASFGKFGDIPVGEFTGSAQVNVPLYTISHRGVSIPLNLSYHSNGIQVSQEAGWAGLGWSLNTGGMITRAIRGYDDFGNRSLSIDCSGQSNNYTNYWSITDGAAEIPSGFAAEGNMLDNNNLQQVLPGNNSGLATFDYTFENGVFYAYDFCQAPGLALDYESDLYTYNFLGYSGKFIIGRDGNIVFLDANDLKITPQVFDVDDVRWEVTTPQGVKIYLGTTRDSRQLTYTFTRSTTIADGSQDEIFCPGLSNFLTPDEFISSWYIDEIVLPTGELVDYNYYRSSAKTTPLPTYSASRKDKLATQQTQSTQVGGSIAPRVVINQSVTYLQYDNNYLASIYIDAIDELIKFNFTQDRLDLLNGLALNDIEIERGGNLYKKLVFNYDYFNTVDLNTNRWDVDFAGNNTINGNPVIDFGFNSFPDFEVTPNLVSKRLKLESILQKGSDNGSDIPLYSFSYNENLPVKTSYAVDHWGFYNGVMDNESFFSNRFPLISQGFDCEIQNVFNDIVGANREASKDYVYEGLLKSIVYPTGGKSEFEYESNQYALNRYQNEYTLTNRLQESIVFEKSTEPIDFCNSSAIPEPSYDFVIDNGHPDLATSIAIDLSWKIASCDNIQCNSLSQICLNPAEDLGLDSQIGFKYTLEKLDATNNYIEIESWNWHDFLADGYLMNGDDYTDNAFIVFNVQVGTYRLRFQKIDPSSNNGEFLWNLLEAEMDVSWNLYTPTGDTDIDPEALVVIDTPAEPWIFIKSNDNNEYCNSSELPAPTDYFYIDNANPILSTCAQIDYSWVIANCQNGLCSTPYPCLDPSGESFGPDIGFQFILENDQGEIIRVLDWSALDYTTDEVGNFFGNISITTEELLPGDYRLRINLTGGVLATELPWNLIEAQMSISWNIYGEPESYNFVNGGGARISSSKDFTETENEANSRYYNYNEDGDSKSSGKIHGLPVYSYVLSEVEARHFAQFTIAGIAFGGHIRYTENVYLNRVVNSLTPLSSTYHGNYVGYSNIKVSYGTEDGVNGYTNKIFFNEVAEPVPDLLRVFDMPRFENHRNGSLLEEEIYSNTGAIVKSNSYQYNENWGGFGSDLSLDDRFKPQWGLRIFFPLYIQLNAAFSNIIVCNNEGNTGPPSLFAYRDYPQWHYIESAITKTYGEDGTYTESLTEYQYEDIHFNLIEEKITSENIEWTTGYQYAEELGEEQLVLKNMTGIPLEVTAPNGITYLTDYDDIRFVPQRFTETYQDGSSIVRTEITSYDPNSYPLQVNRFGFDTPETYVWKTANDESAPYGLLEKKTYLAWEQEYFYNDFRQLERSIAIDDQEVEYFYDPHGRLNQVGARPNGDFQYHIQITTTYELGGPNIVTNVTTYSDAPTQTTSNYFDGLGRPTKTKINGVTKSETLYDNLGRISASTYLPGSFTNYMYDGSPLNRLTEETYPDGNIVSFMYTAENNEWVTSRTNERDFITKNYTDILGRQSKMEDALGRITKHAYDVFGRLFTIESPAGSYTYNYDDRNRLISKKIPGALTSNYCYDNTTDLLCVSTDGNGNRLSMQYDAYQRQTEVFHTLASINNGGHQCDCGTVGQSILTYQYDGVGLGQEGNSPIYTGKLSYSTAALLGASGIAETFYHLDDFGRVKKQRDKANINGSNILGRQTFTLNHADWLLNTAHVINGVANGGGYSHSFAYDDFGRPISENAAGITTAMKYNDQDQLLYKIFDGGTSRQDYIYNSRGWLTDINILQPEVLTPEDFLSIGTSGSQCQIPMGDQQTYVTEEEVTVEEFFDLLCQGQTVVVPDVEECPSPEPTCMEVFNDYTLTQNYLDDLKLIFKNEFENFAHIFNTLSDISGIPLSGYDYCLIGSPGNSAQSSTINTGSHFDVCQQFDPDISATITNDLSNWLDTNGYSYESISVSHSRGVLQISITKTNYPFTNVTVGNYFYGTPNGSTNAGYHNRSISYDLQKSVDILEPCSETTLTIAGSGSGYDGGNSGGGVSQGGNGSAGNTVLPPLDPNNFNFPVNLYETILPDGTKLWLFDFELSTYSEYQIGIQIEIVSNQQMFRIVTTDGSIYIVNFPGLINYRNINASLQDVAVVAMGSNPGDDCPPPIGTCTPANQTAQQASLNAICTQTMDMLANGTLTYPIDVAIVELCNGEITYILDQLADQIIGDHQILNTFEIDEDGLTVQVLIAEPLFAMQFDHQSNGNIEQIKYKIASRPTSVYDYTYDDIDRVTHAGFWEEYYLDQMVTPPSGEPYISRTLEQDFNNRYNASFSYDGAGNIETIWRNGVGIVCGPEGQIDKLELTYGGESGQQLIHVFDDAAGSLKNYGFKPHSSPNHGSLEYEYDFNGNMTHDPHKDLDIIYNFLNLPQVASKNGSERLKTVYDATGRKWMATSTIASSTGLFTETKVYVNGMEFSGEGTAASHISSINASSNGRIAYGFDQQTGALNSRAEYYHTDHLGNIRLAFSDLDGDNAISVADIFDPNNEITQEQHYYPFGLTHNGPWYATVAPDNAYLYNGKEFDEGTGHYFYGFRMYDPAIARFTGVDPIADQFAHLSVYNYASNDPIKNIDLHGLQGVPNWLKDKVNAAVDRATANTGLGNYIYRDGNSLKYTPSFAASSYKAGRVAQDVAIIAGGIITTYLSGGTGTGAYAAAFGVTTGVFATAAGGAKLATDLQGDYNQSDKIPTSPLGGFGMLVDQVNEDGGFSAQSIGDIASGFLLLGTADWKAFDALNNADKILTIQGIVSGVAQQTDVNISSEAVAQEVLHQIYEPCNEDCNE